MHDTFEELVVLPAVHVEHSQRGPRMDRRVDVPEGPLVGGQLSVRMHVPLPAEEHELMLSELGVDVRERYAMKRQVPSRVPRVLPLVRHRDDVSVAEVLPA